MTPQFDLEAMHMFTRAGIDKNADDVRVLANDLTTLADNELDGELSEAAHQAYQAACILKERIGGLANLRGYVDVLLAQERRRQRRKDSAVSETSQSA
jgi:hypothetical protein